MATLAEIRDLNPDLAGLDDEQLIGAVAQSTGKSFGEVASRVGAKAFSYADKVRAMNPDLMEKSDAEIAAMVAAQQKLEPDAAQALVGKQRLLKDYSQAELDKMDAEAVLTEARLQGLVRGRDRGGLSTGLESAADSVTAGLAGRLSDAASSVASYLSGKPQFQREFEKALAISSRQANPGAALTGDVAGAIAQGVAAAPLGIASAAAGKLGQVGGRIAEGVAMNVADQAIRSGADVAIDGKGVGEAAGEVALAGVTGLVGGAAAEGVIRGAQRGIDLARLTRAERVLADVASKDGVKALRPGESLIDVGGDAAEKAAAMAAKSETGKDLIEGFTTARRRAAGSNIADAADSAAGVSARGYDEAGQAVLSPLEAERRKAFAIAGQNFRQGELVVPEGVSIDTENINRMLPGIAESVRVRTMRGEIPPERSAFQVLMDLNRDLRNAAQKELEGKAPNERVVKTFKTEADMVRDLLDANTNGLTKPALAKGEAIHAMRDAGTAARNIVANPGGVSTDAIQKVAQAAQSSPEAAQLAAIGYAKGLRDASLTGIKPRTLTGEGASQVRAATLGKNAGKVDDAIQREIAREARDAAVLAAKAPPAWMEGAKAVGIGSVPAIAGGAWSLVEGNGGSSALTGAGLGALALGGRALANRSLRKAAPDILEGLYRPGAKIPQRAAQRQNTDMLSRVARQGSVSILDSLIGQ